MRSSRRRSPSARSKSAGLERQGFFRQGGLDAAQPQGPGKLQGAPRQGRRLQRLLHRGAGRRAGGAGGGPACRRPSATVCPPASRPPRRMMAGRRASAAGMAVRAGAAEVRGRRAVGGARRVWLLLGDKPGDNAQVEAVALALGWPCERRTLHWARYTARKAAFRATLDHVDRARSDPLEPPWPDLVLTIGRRPSMVALWIEAQSGGRTRWCCSASPPA